MTPIGELRSAIPVAKMVYKMPMLHAYIIAVLGNLIPVVFLLLFLEKTSEFLKRHLLFFDKFFSWFSQKTKKKMSPQIKKFGALALVIFVALPLPTTGAWSGSLVAFLFNIPFKKAFPLIALGVMIAGVVISLATQTSIIIF